MQYKITEKKTKWFLTLLIVLLLGISAPILISFLGILIFGPEVITNQFLDSSIITSIFLIVFFAPFILYHFYLNFPILPITIEFTEQKIEILLHNKIFKSYNMHNIKEISINRDSRGTKNHHIITIKNMENESIKFRTGWLRLIKANRMEFIDKLKEYCEAKGIPYLYSEVKQKSNFKELDWANRDILKFIKENKRKWWKILRN